MQLVIPAIFFLLYYLIIMLVCGVICWDLERMVGREEKEEASDFVGRVRVKEDVASFLIGTGFAPFVVGITQALLLLALAGLNHQVYAVIHIVLAVAALGWMRRSVLSCLSECIGYVKEVWSGSRTICVVSFGVLAVVFAVVGYYSLNAALRPTHQHDATVYALDARRVVEGRSVQSLLGAEPDDDNQITNHNHGSSYQFYLATALLFGVDTRQDFPVRVAQHILAVHVFLCLLGLAFRVSGAVALVAPILLLFNHTYEYTIYASSRDPYIILAIITAIGVVGGSRLIIGLNARTCLLLFAYAFLWNSHASSMLIVPTILASTLLSLRDWKQRVALVGVVSFSTVLGGSSILETFFRTGDPTAASFDYYRMFAGTPLLTSVLSGRGAPAPGVASLFEKLVRQFKADGSFIVSGLWLSVAVFVTWFVLKAGWKRRIGGLPFIVAIIGAYVLLFEAQIAGLLDWVDDRISVLLAMNLRYRLPVYPLVSVLVGWTIVTAIQRILSRGYQRWVVVCACVLLIGGVWSVSRHWRFYQDMPALVDSRAGDEFLAREVGYFGFMNEFKAIPRDELILMDPAYHGWYHTPNRIVSLFDPRLRGAFLAKDPKEALQILDKIGVKVVCLPVMDFRLLSEIPFGEALDSEEFRFVSEVERWRILRHVH